MHVEIISQQADLPRLREAWEAVYSADPEAQFFLSWTWLSRWLASGNVKSLILAAKRDADSNDYIGFFPLRTRTRMNRDGSIYRELAMAGNRVADYTGYICLPDHAAEVTLAFARQLKAMSWTQLSLDCIALSESRLSLFLASFPKRDFRLVERRMVSRDDIDNGICPYVSLPDDFDRYLDEQLGPSTRQKARRFLRKVDEPGSDFRITHATGETFERDMEIMVAFWKEKWSSRKGDKTEPIINVLRSILRHCQQRGALFLPVLWEGQTPLGALGILIDAVKRTFLFQVSGLDTSRNNPAPGLLLHAYSIRHAIRNGFVKYDFLRGNEPYKYMFGAQERRIRYLSMRCHSAKPSVPVLKERPPHLDMPPWQGAASHIARQLPQLPLSGVATPPVERPAAAARGLNLLRSS